MGLKKKTPKGEISIGDNNGRIRLRWRFGGERYSLNLPYAYLSENMHYATLKAAEIKLDIAKECLDPTLEKYNPAPAPVISKPIIVASKPDNSSVFLNGLVNDFNNWGKNIQLDNMYSNFYSSVAWKYW